MTHKRQIVRDAIVARLLELVPGLDGKVFANRARPAEPGELPLALVYTLSESAQAVTIGRSLLRTLTVIVEIRARLAEGSDDFLDDLCQAVEKAIAVDPTLGRKAMSCVLGSTAIGLDGEGETRQMLAALTFTVQYRTDPTGE